MIQTMDRLLRELHENRRSREEGKRREELEIILDYIETVFVGNPDDKMLFVIMLKEWIDSVYNQKD